MQWCLLKRSNQPLDPQNVLQYCLLCLLKATTFHSLCLRTNSPWLTPGFDVILLMQPGAQCTRWDAKFSYDHFLNGTLLNLEYCFVFVCPGSCGFDLVPYWWCDCSYWVNGVLLCVDKDIYYTNWQPTSLEHGGYLIRQRELGVLLPIIIRCIKYYELLNPQIWLLKNGVFVRSIVCCIA